MVCIHSKSRQGCIQLKRNAVAPSSFRSNLGYAACLKWLEAWYGPVADDGGYLWWCRELGIVIAMEWTFPAGCNFLCLYQDACFVFFRSGWSFLEGRCDVMAMIMVLLSAALLYQSSSWVPRPTPNHNTHKNTRICQQRDWNLKRFHGQPSDKPTKSAQCDNWPQIDCRTARNVKSEIPQWIRIQSPLHISPLPSLVPSPESCHM